MVFPPLPPPISSAADLAAGLAPGLAPGLAADTAAISPAGSAAGSSSSFAQQLSGALDQMQNLQSSATTQVNQLVGGGGEDVHASMIAVEKADLAFGMMLQLRNKAVQAYQDISHMAF